MRWIWLPLVLAACGDDAGELPVDAGTTDGTLVSDAPSGCVRDPAPADRTRFVVVAHPYDANGGRAATFEVLELSASGELTRPTPRRTFTLADRASYGTIEITPDGEIGLVALENGSLGVFRLDAEGNPSVIHEGLAGSFYATKVVMDPRGDRAWILEGNTRENGGGIYRVSIGCDGTVTDEGLYAAADLPHGLAFVGDRAVVAARDLLDSTTPGHDVHLARWGVSPGALAGADAFGDDDAIVGGTALTSDGKTFLVGDTSAFSGVPNRVAVVGVGQDALTPITVLSPIPDPQAIATSPFGDVAIVSSALDGDAIYVLDTGGTGGAWRIRGELAYAGAAPLLPGDVATISRGALRGRVLVSELSSVRQLAFRDTGAVEDLGSLQFGDGLENIGGAIGVTP